jgi:hypothetical protein
MESSALVGVDRALVRLYRSIGLRCHLKDTLQTESPLFNMTTHNITTAYEHLQLYNDYDGSYQGSSWDGMGPKKGSHGMTDFCLSRGMG